MNRNRTWLSQLGNLILALSLSGATCSPTNTLTVIPIPTETGTLQTITTSQTVMPSIQTLTHAPIPSPTLTQRPLNPTSQNILSADEAKSLLLDLLQSNGNCVLPCLWGITPSEKASNALDPLFARFKKGSTISGDVALRFDDFDGIGGVNLSYIENQLDIVIGFSYYMTGDRVDQLVLVAYATKTAPAEGEVFGNSTFNQLVQYYALSRVISDYGRPTQVFIAPFPDDPDYPSPEWIPFSTVLYYADKGILIQYLSPRETRGDQYIGCPHKAHVDITVWDFQRKLTLNDIVDKISGRGINKLNVDYFKPIEEATSITLDGFVEMFSDMQTLTCIETPISLWP